MWIILINLLKNSKTLQLCSVVSFLILKKVWYVLVPAWCQIIPSHVGLGISGNALVPKTQKDSSSIYQSGKGIGILLVDQTHLRYYCQVEDFTSVPLFPKIYSRYSLSGRWIWVTLQYHIHPLYLDISGQIGALKSPFEFVILVPTVIFVVLITFCIT